MKRSSENHDRFLDTGVAHAEAVFGEIMETGTPMITMCAAVETLARMSFSLLFRCQPHDKEVNEAVSMMFQFLHEKNGIPNGELFGATTEDDRKAKQCVFPSWRPLEKELPEEGRQVLVTGIAGDKRFVDVSCRRDVTYWDRYGRINILAWMPLPPPWKGGLNDENRK